MALSATYQEINQPVAADLVSEVLICHFLDGAKTVIDWSEWLREIQNLVSHSKEYAPEQSHLVSDMDANSTAIHLLST
jgi:hypothetical protein